MADHALQFSFEVPFPEGQESRIAEFRKAMAVLAAERNDWMALGGAARGALSFEQAFPFSAEAAPEVRAAALDIGWRLAFAMDDVRDLADTNPACEVEIEYGPRSVVLYTSGYEYGNVNVAAALVEAMQDRFGAGPVGFAWAATCSKPRPGEFGGGAVWVENGQAEFLSTSDWLFSKRQQAKAAAAGERTRAAGAPPLAVVRGGGVMQLRVALPDAAIDEAREALAVVDQEGADWTRAYSEPEALDFARAFPHRAGSPPGESVQALALSLLRVLSAPESGLIEDAGELPDITDGHALAPSSYVTTMIMSAPGGGRELHVLSAEQDDYECLPRAFRACRAVAEAVRDHFHPAPEPAAGPAPG